MKSIKSLFIVVFILSMVGCGQRIPEDIISKAYVVCEDHGGLEVIDDTLSLVEEDVWIVCHDDYAVMGYREIRKQWAKKKLGK